MKMFVNKEYKNSIEYLKLNNLSEDLIEYGKILLEVPQELLNLLKEHPLIKDFRLVSSNHWTKANDSRDVPNLLHNIKAEFFIDNNWWAWSQLSDGTKRLFHIIGHLYFEYFK
ncbi:MAG: hypothetical protein RI894_1982 [Bacteroidota bacterium]|jgi:hypothetical protein